MQTLAQLRKGELQGAVSLKLAEGLSEFPREIFELSDTLEMLDLSHNKLSALPADLGRLHKLKILFCYNNQFKVLPEVLADCKHLDIAGFRSNNIAAIPPRALNTNLRWLILTSNQISELPPEIGNCHRIQKLMLAGNRLKDLPIELSKCRNLGLLRISVNQFTHLPSWLLQMPSLSWLAFSGNPFCTLPTVGAPSLIDWDDLEIGELLGQGTSGLIYKATRKTDVDHVAVAVKIYKGEMTSDGFPDDEISACIAAGAHPGLVEVLGQITGHPENKKGLVMGLIPPHYQNLGITPSLESCTRDVFKADMRLGVNQILKIAHTMASVGAHLHAKAIIHADMYAHNTLIDDEGNTLFGDFGGACFYDKTDAELAVGLERLEVSAFGCLLDDLLGLTTEPSHPKMLKLSAIRDACLDHDVPSRPTFQNLEEQLKAVMP